MLNKLNDWLTLASNLAVLTGIVFLVIEINQNTEALRLQTIEQRTSEQREMNFALMESERYWIIHSKLKKEISDLQPFGNSVSAKTSDWKRALSLLSEEERGRFFMLALTQWNNLQNIWEQFDRELISEEEFKVYRSYTEQNAAKFSAFGFGMSGQRPIDLLVQSSR